MSEILSIIANTLMHITAWTFTIIFFIWQIKLCIKGKFNIFTILGSILKHTVLLLFEIFLCMIDESIGESYRPKKDSKKYLDTASALSLGVSLEDVYSYNMGNPVTKVKLEKVEPYIQKTKYF